MVAKQLTQGIKVGALSNRPANTRGFPPQYPYEDHFQRQQAKPAQQALHCVRARHDMAQSLGQKLGSSFVLL
jgi:hypothetical protein